MLPAQTQDPRYPESVSPFWQPEKNGSVCLFFLGGGSHSETPGLRKQPGSPAGGCVFTH